MSLYRVIGGALGNLLRLIMLILAVSEDTITRARSLTDMRGSKRSEGSMEDILGSADLGNGRSVHIASLARDTIIDAGAEHLGFDGYFVFEAVDVPGEQGINVLCKTASYEAALRLIDVMGIG
jgi:hypothetical protein